MVREEVSNGARTFSFVRGEHVVELQGTREKAQKDLAKLLLLNARNRLGKHADYKKLARIEHLEPMRVTVANRLVRIVPWRNRVEGIWARTLPQGKFRLAIEVTVTIVRRQVRSGAIRCEYKFGVEAVRWRLAECPYDIHDLEVLMARITSRHRPGYRTPVRIVLPST